MKDSESLDQWQDLLAGYVLGDLSPEDAIRVRQYLAEHPEQTAEIEKLQSAIALIALSLPEETPPADLKARILQSAEATPQASSAEPHPIRSSVRRRRRINPIWVIAGGVAACAIATLATMNYQLRQEVAQLKQQQQLLVAREAELSRYQDTVALLRQPNNRLFKLAGTGTMTTASGSFVLTPSRQSAILVLQNLPPLPENRRYQLWAVVHDQKMPCPKFLPDAEGRVFLKLPAEQLMETSKVVITVEPMEETPQPTGEMVLSGV